MRHTSNISSDSVTLGEPRDLGTHVDDGTNSLMSGDQLSRQPSRYMNSDVDLRGTWQ